MSYWKLKIKCGNSSNIPSWGATSGPGAQAHVSHAGLYTRVLSEAKMQTLCLGWDQMGWGLQDLNFFFCSCRSHAFRIICIFQRVYTFQMLISFELLWLEQLISLWADGRWSHAVTLEAKLLKTNTSLEVMQTPARCLCEIHSFCRQRCREQSRVVCLRQQFLLMYDAWTKIESC